MRITPFQREGHLGFEDLDRLADDPHAVELAVLEFQLDVDAAGTMHVVALGAGELRGGARMGQQALLGEVGA